MTSEELSRLVRLSYDHVGKQGRESARIYVAVVALDGMAMLWRKRAIALGWVDPVDEKPPDQ